MPSSIGLGEAVGIGYQLIETKDYTLEVEVGPGVRQSQLRDTDDFEAKYIGRLVGVVPSGSARPA